MKSILITGGAGFIGSNLALLLKKSYPNCKIVCLDNLKRRGSELNLPKFKANGIEFVHGDIRVLEDLTALNQNFDLMIEASAEPSVLAGVNGDPSYVIQTNLEGTLRCLTFARKHVKRMIFLSTSRIYSIEAMKGIELTQGQTRFTHKENLNIGLTAKGITEKFPTTGHRSFYGSTKLTSEMMIEEYCHNFNIDVVINRCSVICGRGQWGKVDQGAFTLWVVNHFFKKPLKYTGFGGEGKQVRDLLHPTDLFELIKLQIEDKKEYRANIFNIGGGLNCSTSLLELTKICEEVTGNTIQMNSDPTTANVDVPFYITDSSKAHNEYNWKPRKTIRDIVEDIHGWLNEEKDQVRDVFDR